MKIYFLASFDVGEDKKNCYRQIIDYLSELGFTVSQSIFDRQSHVNQQDLKYENVYDRVIKKIDQSDIVVAEISSPSAGVGYQIYHALYQKKPLIVLYSQNCGSNPSVIIRGISSNRVHTLTYDDFTDLKKSLPDLMNTASKQTKVRFNLIINNRDLSLLNLISQKKKISTNALIRSIIIKYLKSQTKDN